MREFEDAGLKISVWEMSRAQALACQRDFNDYLETGETDPDKLSEEIDFLMVRHTPCRVEYADGDAARVLEAGSHKVELDGKEYTLTLPLTRACFDSLPYYLTFLWGQKVGEVNTFNVNFLWARRAAILETQKNGASVSVSGPSSTHATATK